LRPFDLTFLKDLVNIDSQTQNVSGVTRAQELCAARLEAMGMQVQMHANQECESASALVATHGDGPLNVTLLGHTDTVLSGGSSFPFKQEDNGLITGAGIADMKAGVAIMMDTLREIAPIVGDELKLRVVLSPNEETGSTGFHDLFRSIGADSDLVLCFEPALEDGSIITGRNGNRWYGLKLTGDRFHTGRALKGRPNALHQLCEIVTSLESGVSDQNGVKFNISSVNSDSQNFNVSSGLVEAKMDLRFETLKQRDDFHQSVTQWKDEPDVNLELSISDDCPPLENVFGEKIMRSMKQLISAAEEDEIFCQHCEGASDANYFSHPSNIVIDGLGARGLYFHSKKEYIEAKSLGHRSEALQKFLLEMARDARQIHRNLPIHTA
jgi:glutamate carboxypeptidase